MIFGPKIAKFGPIYAFLVILGQILAFYPLIYFISTNTCSWTVLVFFLLLKKHDIGCVIACYSILLLGIVWLVECSALFLAQCIALFLSGVASSHRWFKHSITGNTLIHSFSITGYRVLSIIYCHYKHLLGKGCRKNIRFLGHLPFMGGGASRPQYAFFSNIDLLKVLNSAGAGEGRIWQKKFNLEHT